MNNWLHNSGPGASQETAADGLSDDEDQVLKVVQDVTCGIEPALQTEGGLHRHKRADLSHEPVWRNALAQEGGPIQRPRVVFQ